MVNELLTCPTCNGTGRKPAAQMTKNVVQANIDNGTFKKQHRGNKGSSDTYMYYGEENSPTSIRAQYLQ